MVSSMSIDPAFDLVPSFEQAPGFRHNAEHAEFNDFLKGRELLADAQGGVSAADFVEDAIAAAVESDLELDDHKVAILVRNAFGSPFVVLERLRSLSTQEAEELYSPGMLKLLTAYIEPILE